MTWLCHFPSVTLAVTAYGARLDPIPGKRDRKKPGVWQALGALDGTEHSTRQNDVIRNPEGKNAILTSQPENSFLPFLLQKNIYSVSISTKYPFRYYIVGCKYDQDIIPIPALDKSTFK